MSEEINDQSELSKERFSKKLHEEMHKLEHLLNTNKLKKTQLEVGFELEFFCVDQSLSLNPLGKQFIKSINHPQVVQELSACEFEINSDYGVLQDQILTTLEKNLQQLLDLCSNHAKKFDSDVLMIGTLPHLNFNDPRSKIYSDSSRYSAVSNLIKLQEKRFINIRGQPEWMSPENPMQANAFQTHLKVSPHEFRRYFNAAIVLAGPLLSISGNSAFLFEQSYLHESRIAYFEKYCQFFTKKKFTPRCLLSYGYAQGPLNDFLRLYTDDYHPILPAVLQNPEEKFYHLRIYFGTVYHWVRPVIGYDDDGSVHLRIEFRPLSSGTTIPDMMAIAAVYFGAMKSLATQATPIETVMPFSVARGNFYRAALLGQNARLRWGNQRSEISGNELMLKTILPMAKSGLLSCGVSSSDVERYIEIITKQLEKNISGSTWQLACAQAVDYDLQILTKLYFEKQKSGKILSEWKIPS